MNSKTFLNFLFLSVLLQSICATTAYAIQDENANPTNRPPATETHRRTRNTPPANTPNQKRNRGSTRATDSTTAGPSRIKRQPPTREPLLANLKIQATPTNSTIFFNGQEIDSREEEGVVNLIGVEAQKLHTITVRNNAYREAQRTITLSPGQNGEIEIALTPLPGRLNINPTVADANISIISKGADSFSTIETPVGNYVGLVSNLELPPGRYVVTVTKSGYITTAIEVIMNPAGTVNLPVTLEPARRMPARTGSAMSVEILSNGTLNGDRFTELRMMGTSGDTDNPSGSIVVTQSGNNGPAIAAGMLPGLPCEVDCAAIENVKSCSFVETPGVVNNWGRVAVRVRFKNSKKAARYAINWRVVEGPMGEAVDPFLPSQNSAQTGAAMRYRNFSSSGLYSLNVPENWRQWSAERSIARFAPEDGYRVYQGQQNIIHGIILGVIQVPGRDLRRYTEVLVKGLLNSYSYLLQQSSYRTVNLAGQEGLTTILSGRTSVTGRIQIINVYTALMRSSHLFFLLTISSEDESLASQPTFQTILSSLRFLD